MNKFEASPGTPGRTPALRAPIAATEGKRRLRLWMVDDDALFRESFAQLLNREARLRVARQFESIKPMLVGLAEERPPDIILLDLNIGTENGLSAIAPVKKLAPGVKVLMLTTFNNTYSEAEAFRLRASGFLLKIYEIDEIIELISRCCHNPGDPRLFPNLTHRTSLPGAIKPKSSAAPRAKEHPGFFNTLRQLCRPRRRQPAD